jgi:hypothetical protein
MIIAGPLEQPKAETSNIAIKRRPSKGKNKRKVTLERNIHWVFVTITITITYA